VLPVGRSIIDSISAEAENLIADAVWDEALESTYTGRQMMRIFTAVLAGLANGGGSTTINFRDIADGRLQNKARIKLHDAAVRTFEPVVRHVPEAVWGVAPKAWTVFGVGPVNPDQDWMLTGGGGPKYMPDRYWPQYWPDTNEPYTKPQFRGDGWRWVGGPN
jgi:hypothetical protein